MFDMVFVGRYVIGGEIDRSAREQGYDAVGACLADWRQLPGGQRQGTRRRKPRSRKSPESTALQPLIESADSITDCCTFSTGRAKI